MKRLITITLASIALAMTVSRLKPTTATTVTFEGGPSLPKQWLTQNPHPIVSASDARPADQTFLTFPEWFLVFGPEEQARYFQKRTSTSFPFTAHIEQFWDSYRVVNAQIKNAFPVNQGYHFMIWVIGTSTTVEYAVKAWYETIIGRLTDTGVVVTAEDEFNYQFNTAYVRFIKDRPWYEFDFAEQLKQLWAVNFTTGNFFRSVERRYILTSELLAKMLYGKLIGIGTQSVYDVALPTTMTVVDRLPEGSQVRVMKLNADSSYTIAMPRYDKFKDQAANVARDGIHFREIAGNTSAILVSFVAPNEPDFSWKTGKVIFLQPFASGSGEWRIVAAAPVSQLDGLLKEGEDHKLLLEHIFDY